MKWRLGARARCCSVHPRVFAARALFVLQGEVKFSLVFWDMVFASTRRRPHCSSAERRRAACQSAPTNRARRARRPRPRYTQHRCLISFFVKTFARYPSWPTAVAITERLPLPVLSWPEPRQTAFLESPLRNVIPNRILHRIADLALALLPLQYSTRRYSLHHGRVSILVARLANMFTSDKISVLSV